MHTELSSVQPASTLLSGFPAGPDCQQHSAKFFTPALLNMASMKSAACEKRHVIAHATCGM